MGKTFLIDTNIILEYTGGFFTNDVNRLFNDIIDNSGLYISVINQIEVLGHPSATEDLFNFLDTAIIYPLTDDVVKQTIELRKVKKIKLPDAIIAATAIIYNHILITRNTRDFKNITNLEVVDPYQL